MANEPLDPAEWQAHEERELAKVRRKIETRRAGISSTALALWTIAALLALALVIYSSRFWHRLR